jgi:hypothetical protein
MNEDLLDADCVINYLVNLNIIKMRVWREGSNPADHIYTKLFDGMHEKCNTVLLEIIKRTAQYYTNCSGIRILTKRYNFDPVPILTRCSIENAT